MSEEYKIIPEDIVEDTAKALMEIGESDNKFSNLMAIGARWKVAGCTPIYLINSSMIMYCVSEETWGRKLH